MFSTPVEAAFTAVQTGSAASFGGTTSFSFTFGAPISAGNFVVGGISCTTGNPNTDTLVITDDKGNTLTTLDQLQDAAQSAISQSFILGNYPAGGATILTATVSPGPDTCGNWGFKATEYSGGSAVSNPTDGHTVQLQTSPGTGVDGVSSGPITTTTNGDLIFGITVDTTALGTAATQGTGFAARTGGTSSLGTTNEDLTQGSAGSISATWTQGSNDRHISYIIAVKPPGGAAPVLPSRALLGVGR